MIHNGSSEEKIPVFGVVIRMEKLSIQLKLTAVVPCCLFYHFLHLFSRLFFRSNIFVKASNAKPINVFDRYNKCGLSDVNIFNCDLHRTNFPRSEGDSIFGKPQKSKPANPCKSRVCGFAVFGTGIDFAEHMRYNRGTKCGTIQA